MTQALRILTDLVFGGFKTHETPNAERRFDRVEATLIIFAGTLILMEIIAQVLMARGVTPRGL